MIEPEIAPEALDKWASILLDHALGGIGASDRVMVKGERICWPLMDVIQRKVLEAGGVPDVFLVAPDNERGRAISSTVARAMGSAAPAAPEWLAARYRAMTHFIEVMGSEVPATYAGLDGVQTARIATVERPMADLRMSHPWVLTLYPTSAQARIEGLSLADYTRFLVEASTTDPRPLQAAQEVLAPLIDEGRRITLVTASPHDGRERTLSLDITLGRSRLCYGVRNFPDGEIFTCPHANGVEGEIYLDLPVHIGGDPVQGIRLGFEGGRIVDYDADVGAARLATVIENDDGSHRLGEVAFGMNPGIQRVLKHPLLLEKVGGTAHIAIGQGFDECFVDDHRCPEGQERVAVLVREGVLNRSAQHVDIVVDFRPGGAGRRAFVDDHELIVRSGVWVPA